MSAYINFRRLGRMIIVTLLAVAAVGTGLLLLTGVFRQHHPFLYDFKGGLYNAGTAILNGHSPYQPEFLARQAAIMRAGGIAIGETTQHSFSIPLYPAPANLAVVPFSLLPFWAAGALFTLISTLAMVVGLRLLGVRDWRCFTIALLSWPFVYSLDLGALGPLLLLGVAVIWRWRDHVLRPAVALAAVVAVKIFPWTLAVWLLFTRRYRTLVAAIVIGLAVTLGAWGLIGFDGLRRYPQMLSNASFIQEGRGTSLVAIMLAAGVSSSVAQVGALLAGLGLLLAAWRVSLRTDGAGAAFGLALIAALTASPLVWDHYLVLLFVPIALISPRISALWLLPAGAPLLYALSVMLVPFGNTAAAATPDVRAAVVWVALEAIVTVRLLRASTRDSATNSKPNPTRLPMGSTGLTSAGA